ncbi:MAG: DUF1080 domain-containing protein [Thermoproteota archaeon]|nr:DUF1080 domain-containing protein [Thermoproteota archaeon]
MGIESVNEIEISDDASDGGCGCDGDGGYSEFNECRDFVNLFDGTLNGWRMAGKGGFKVIFEEGPQQVRPYLKTYGGMGLLWYCTKMFRDFVLRLEWKVCRMADNSGIFVRFSDPQDEPCIAVNTGYEIQIDDVGQPDGNPIHMTGAIYSFKAPAKITSKPVGEWNRIIINVMGQRYTIIINNDTVVKDFVGNRLREGYIGLQNHDEQSIVCFRNIMIKEIH